MKNLTLNLLTVAALAFSPVVWADGAKAPQPTDDKTAQKATETDAKDQAKADETDVTDTTKAEAAYEEARRRCEAGAASDQDACVQRAETARTKAMSDAQTGVSPKEKGAADETSANAAGKSSAKATDRVK